MKEWYRGGKICDRQGSFLPETTKKWIWNGGFLPRINESESVFDVTSTWRRRRKLSFGKKSDWVDGEWIVVKTRRRRRCWRSTTRRNGTSENRRRRRSNRSISCFYESHFFVGDKFNWNIVFIIVVGWGCFGFGHVRWCSFLWPHTNVWFEMVKVTVENAVFFWVSIVALYYYYHTRRKFQASPILSSYSFFIYNIYIFYFHNIYIRFRDGVINFVFIMYFLVNKVNWCCC